MIGDRSITHSLRSPSQSCTSVFLTFNRNKIDRLMPFQPLRRPVTKAAAANTGVSEEILLFFSSSGGWGKQSLSSPRFHVFSYTSCVDLPQLLSQSSASWLAGVSFGSHYSERASGPYRRSPLLLRQRKNTLEQNPNIFPGPIT